MIEESSLQIANACVFMPEKRLLQKDARVWRPAYYLYDVGEWSPAARGRLRNRGNSGHRPGVRLELELNFSVRATNLFNSEKLLSHGD